jgi:hypothetical protein
MNTVRNQVMALKDSICNQVIASRLYMTLSHCHVESICNQVIYMFDQAATNFNGYMLNRTVGQYTKEVIAS